MAKCSQCDKAAVADGPAGAFCLEHEEQFQRVMALRQATTVAATDDLWALAEARVGLPPGSLRRQPSPLVHHSGPVTNINVRDIINNGGMQIGGHSNTQNSTVQWNSPEAAAALDKLIADIEKIHDDCSGHMLEILAEMKGSKNQPWYLELADQAEKLAKTAPALRWVWQVAKPHLGL
jgi:hypothetical protein